MSHNETTRETKIIAGLTGNEVIKKGYSLDDPNLWPLELVTFVDGILIKIQANCLKGKEYTLNINDKDYHSIPYMSAPISSARSKEGPDEEKIEELHGIVSLNGTPIYEGETMPMRWSKDNCKTLINATIGE